MRDNLLLMGSATNCYFVNPKYEEAWGSPCYPDLASLPEVAMPLALALEGPRVVESASVLGPAIGALR